MFNRYDLNRNGTISKAEWRGDKLAFARLDSNNDGKLGNEEFERQYRDMEKRFNTLDRDHNGVLTREEWRGQSAGNFDKLDDNRDGQITLEEFVGAV
jgi:Ca2+-binding EF-hand superfamily protein